MPLQIEDEDEGPMLHEGNTPPDLLALAEAHPATTHLTQPRKLEKHPAHAAPYGADDIDFVKDAKPKKLNTQDLANLSSTAKRLLHQQERIAFYEEKLKEAKEQARSIEENDLPQLMLSVGMSSFKLDTGHTIEVKEIVAGSISEPKREGALKWLKENGHSGIIKHDFKVELPANVVKDVKKAAALKAAMEKLGVTVVDKETVHPQTLLAWAREMLSAPETAGFPQETLGIYVGRRATVKQPVKTN